MCIRDSVYPPAPTTIVFAGIPIGVAYAQEPPITHAIRTALGSAPMPCAMDIQIGAINAVVAVFDMKFVSRQQSTNTTNVNTYGDGLSPSIAITFPAIISPAPVSPRADASESVPPNRKIVFRSMDFKASFSDVYKRQQPVPYVFFTSPASKQHWPNNADCWSPAAPAIGILSPNIPTSVYPVSYTHLDVYKRQVLGRYLNAEEANLERKKGNYIVEEPGKGFRRIVSAPNPVSICLLYTSTTLFF